MRHSLPVPDFPWDHMQVTPYLECLGFSTRIKEAIIYTYAKTLNVIVLVKSIGVL